VDLRHAPTYRLLVSLYDKIGERERVARVLTILDMLGYAEDVERAYLNNLRGRLSVSSRLGPLSDPLRAQFLLPLQAQGPLLEIFQVVREQLLALYPMPYVGEAPQPAEDPAITVVAQDLRRLFGVEAQVLVAQDVPGGVVAFDVQKPIAVIDLAYIERTEAERRFAMARAFEPLRGGYGLLMRLGPREREDVGLLLYQLSRPDSEREPGAIEFVRQLPRKAQKALEKLAVGGQPLDSVAWMSALALGADRAGLLACDDVSAAARVLVRMGGSDLPLGADAAVALGAVPGGAELVRYYLGDEYHRLRSALAQEGGRP